MDKKKVKIGIGILVSALALAGIAFLMYVKQVKRAGVNETGPPKTTRALRRMVKQIAGLDSPKCQNIGNEKGDPGQLWLECFREAYEARSARMYEISDPKLAPELIKIASNANFKVPRQIPDDEDIRRKYRLLMCSIRFTAIQTLGKLRDPRAITPLVQIMGEPYTTDCVGCYFGSDTSICTITAKELSKFEDPGMAQKLLKNLEQHPYKSYDQVREAIEQKKAGGRIVPEQAWVESQDTLISECSIEALSRLGAGGRKAIFKKLESGGLNDAQLQLFLEFLGKPKLDPESFDLAKKYLGHKNKAVSNAAADILAGSAGKARKDFYISLYDQGFYRQAAVAFGKIKTPDLAPRLIEILKKTDDAETTKAVFLALKEFKPEEVRPALPLLVQKMKNNQDMLTDQYYDVLKAAKDPSVIKDLTDMLHDPKMAMGIQVDTIAAIGDPQARAALRNIIADKNYAEKVVKSKPLGQNDEKEILERLNRVRVRAMYWYLVLEGESAKPYCSKYFDPKIVDGQWAQAQVKRKTQSDL